MESHGEDFIVPYSIIKNPGETNGKETSMCDQVVPAMKTQGEKAASASHSNFVMLEISNSCQAGRDAVQCLHDYLKANPRAHEKAKEFVLGFAVECRKGYKISNNSELKEAQTVTSVTIFFNDRWLHSAPVGVRLVVNSLIECINSYRIAFYGARILQDGGVEKYNFREMFNRLLSEQELLWEDISTGENKTTAFDEKKFMEILYRMSQRDLPGEMLGHAMWLLPANNSLFQNQLLFRAFPLLISFLISLCIIVASAGIRMCFISFQRRRSLIENKLKQLEKSFVLYKNLDIDK